MFHRRWIAGTALLVASSSVVLAQSATAVIQPVNTQTGIAPDAPGRAESQLIKVTVATSRSEVTNGGGYGVFADLQNVDTLPLQLRASETMLVVQPELSGKHPCTGTVASLYPTETVRVITPHSSADGAKEVIVIQPQEHYVAFWDITRLRGSCGERPNTLFGQAFGYIREKLAFVPGDYVFVVVGKARRVQQDAIEPTYHTYTDQLKLHVALTQIDAMFAAMLGGLIGYIVTALRAGGAIDPLAPRSEEAVGAVSYVVNATRNVRQWFVVLRNMFSAALVSAVVTILMSRISDTQFPIKITVSDFWGALTVGFIAYFVGNTLIDRIVKLAAAKDADSGTNNTPTPPKTTGPNPKTSQDSDSSSTASPVTTETDASVPQQGDTQYSVTSASFSRAQ